MATRATARSTTVLHRVWRALLVVAAAASTAVAGIADSPLPRFSNGKTSVPVFFVTGVVKRGPLQTDFLCTSFAAAPVDIGVEIFDADGTRLNDVNTGAGAVLDVAPGQTVTIATSGTRAFLETTVVPLVKVSQGSARVVASAPDVRCNAVIVDDAFMPPASLATLSPGVRLAVGPLLPGAPLPRFPGGGQATHAAVIPGVTKRGPVQTDVMCTSLADQPIDIGVEIFGPDGTLENRIVDGNGALLGVPPGATVTFGTTGGAAFLEDAVIVTRGVAQGVARVVSTTAAVTCSAIVLDAEQTPPSAMSSLSGGDTGLPGDVNRDGRVNAADVPALTRALYQ